MIFCNGRRMRVDALDLNLIVALEAVVRLRSVSAAAGELGLTQPAVSRALGRLRDHFRDELVTPVGRRMEPTEFGARLFTTATELLQATRAFAQQKPGFEPATAERQFAIGASDYVASVFLTHLTRRLAQCAPGLSIHIVAADVVSDAMIDRGELDFAILPEMVLSPRQPRVELFSDTFVCAAWTGNDQIGATLDVATYLRLRHVATAFGPLARDSHFEAFIRGQGLALPRALALPSFAQVPEFLVGTPYIATIHARLANRLPRAAPLRVFPTPIAIPPLTEHLQWHRSREHDAAAVWLIRLMQDVVAQDMDAQLAVNGSPSL
jgi:LysR family transcriptional regulator, nod-box dependent transcriptional activator